MNYKEIGCEDVDWVHLAQHRVLWQALINMVMKTACSMEHSECE
jgi:hypothetical protein